MINNNKQSKTFKRNLQITIHNQYIFELYIEGNRVLRYRLMQTNVNDLIIAPNKIRYIYFHETRKPISKWLWQKFANAASIMNPGLPDLTFNIWQVVLSRFPRNSSGAHVREGRLVKTMEHWILDEHGVMLLPSSSRFSPSSSPSSLAGWLVVKWDRSPRCYTADKNTWDGYNVVPFCVIVLNVRGRRGVKTEVVFSHLLCTSHLTLKCP